MKTRKQGKRTVASSIARDSLADQSIPVMIGVLGASVGWAFWFATTNTLQPPYGTVWLVNLLSLGGTAWAWTFAGWGIGTFVGGWIRSIMLGRMKEDLKEERQKREEEQQQHVEDLKEERQKREEERQKHEEERQRHEEERREDRATRDLLAELVKQQTGVRGYSRRRRRPSRFVTQRNQGNTSQSANGSPEPPEGAGAPESPT